MALKKTRPDWEQILAEMPYGKTVLESKPKHYIAVAMAAQAAS
jgi:hypothetical protein